MPFGPALDALQAMYRSGSAAGAVVIPLPGNTGDLPFFDLQAVLDGVTYTLQFRWNVRLGAWFVTVLDGEGATVIVGDTALRVAFPLNAYFTGRQPPGAFVLMDTAGAGVDPGLVDLGQRFKLVYFTAAALGLA